MPDGMMGVGGVGTGIFECAQDLTGYINLCFISDDDPELYSAIFKKMGEASLTIWERFIKEYGDIFCVLRFGDDMGFKNSTLLSPRDIRRHLIPGYAEIIKLAHSRGKPFLLHSCGNIGEVMPDLINTARIDAKHSNEDIIVPFAETVKKYGNEIANFGGIDLDVLCQLPAADIKNRVFEILDECVAAKGARGIAFSTGNSIPDYVPAENYIAMAEAVRAYRGE